MPHAPLRRPNATPLTPTLRALRLAATAAATTALVCACGGESVAAQAAVVPAGGIDSLGATGWASHGTPTTGGLGAAAGRTYTVANRNELIQALYGHTAVIAPNGSVKGTPDKAPKVIRIQGTIDLNVDGQLRPYTPDRYVAGSCASSVHGYASQASLWSDYLAAYRPGAWGNARPVSGKPEDARACAAELQRRVVTISVPGNTSLLGIGTDARILHGNLMLGVPDAPATNIVIRNIAFEDAFDDFPRWDPTDSSGGRWNSQYDLISVAHASHVWIDHDTFSDGDRHDHTFPSVWHETVHGTDYSGSDFRVQHHDGLVDVTRHGNYVTLSNNHFHDHDKAFLIGGTDAPGADSGNPRMLKVTFHGNYFQNLRQRQARVRYGMVHLYNNYYENTRDASADYPWFAGMTLGQGGKVHAENNVVSLTSQDRSARPADVANARISAARTQDCAALFSASECASTFHDSGTVLNGAPADLTAAVRWSSALVTAPAWKPSDFYDYALEDTSELAARITARAGAGKLESSAARR